MLILNYLIFNSHLDTNNTLMEYSNYYTYYLSVYKLYSFFINKDEINSGLIIYPR